MDLKRLLYFCTIAEQGQVSRAAAVLNIAQPPLSQRLKELEQELGCALFLRRGRSLQLTEAGKLLHRRARDILHSVDATRDEVIRTASQTGPALRIGLSPTCRSLWLSRFDALRALFPERSVGLVVGDSSYLEHLLLTLQLDAALMQPPMHPENFRVHAIAASRTVAVLPAGLLAPGTDRVALADLGHHSLLLLRRSTGVGSYERLLHCLQVGGFTPRVTLYSSDVDLLLALLGQGFQGIAVIPESEAPTRGTDFRVLPIEVDLPDYPLSLVQRKDDQDQALFEQLLSVWMSAENSVAGTSIQKA